MHSVTSFGLDVLILAGALALALLGSKVTARIALPSAAFFLVGAALASDIFGGLHTSVDTVERVATVALIVILFDGGSSIGWSRFRSAAVPITSLGIVGTFATAGLVTAFAHVAFGLHWLSAGLLGAAVAPTDPAVMFSVIGGRDVHGRAGTILEGESGANDPVGIALMLGLIELATHAGESFWVVVRIFLEEMSIGLVIGVAGGLLERQLMRRVSLPSSGLYAIRTLAGAGIVYGVATIAHGSGFLAVFVAGLVVGDVRAPFKHEIEVFQDALSTLAEVCAFVALGLTIDLTGLAADRWGEGLAVAAFVALAARPLVSALLLAPVRLPRGDRLFVAWGGLKGAVPILLGTFILGAKVAQGQRLYETIFVVVLASVVVQGGTISAAARLFGVDLSRREDLHRLEGEPRPG
jgi:potassium/hydrogen antiporter